MDGEAHGVRVTNKGLVELVRAGMANGKPEAVVAVVGQWADKAAAEVARLVLDRDRLAADNAVLRLETAALREQVGRLHEAAAGGRGDA